MRNIAGLGNFLVLLLALVFLIAAIPALAAAPPDSGAALEGVKPPVGQISARQAPDISVADRELSESEDSREKISVKGFRLSGEPPVPEDELLNLIKGDAGKEMTLGELDKLADCITRYLRRQGYFVAFAYLPAQDIREGIVEIAVVPGKYGQIKVGGSARIDADRIQAMLFCAKPGMIIIRGPLERALLLINDLSGIRVKATLTPGETPGAADLIIKTAATAKASGASYADDWGNRYTGRTRYGAQIAVNNFSGNGDALTLGGLTTGQGIDNYSLGYNANLGHAGAKIEVHYSRVGYTLGEEFADLGATGRAAVASCDISYPFIRSRAFSLYGILGYDDKHLTDDITGYGSYSSRASGLWRLGLSGNFADTWLGGGAGAFSLICYSGELSFNDAAALARDAATARTSGNFNKTVLTYQRQQYIAPNLTFNFSCAGQLASKNLDSSEKLFLGGADGVRAFPQGEASGDEGYKLTGEFRWRLADLCSGKNNLYLTTFYDYGSVTLNKQPYSADINRRSLTGSGLGLLLTRNRGFSLRMDYAWKVGDERAAADDDKSGRLWLQGVKYF
jgi:hemolysin activation/secretion protein